MEVRVRRRNATMKVILSSISKLKVDSASLQRMSSFCVAQYETIHEYQTDLWVVLGMGRCKMDVEPSKVQAPALSTKLWASVNEAFPIPENEQFSASDVQISKASWSHPSAFASVMLITTTSVPRCGVISVMDVAPLRKDRGFGCDNECNPGST